MHMTGGMPARGEEFRVLRNEWRSEISEEGVLCGNASSVTLNR
jgi:hypothetical protein